MKNNNIVTKSGNLMCDGMIVNGDQPDIRSMIYTIRGVQVMLDRDLAMLYGVATGALNQAVKRNSARFPERFMFQMSPEEFANWKSQSVISNSIGAEGIRQMKLRQWLRGEWCMQILHIPLLSLMEPQPILRPREYRGNQIINERF